MIIDTQKIQDLLNSDVTSYQIRKEVGIPTQMIDRYRQGIVKVENMTLKTAIKLMDFIEKNKKNTQ